MEKFVQGRDWLWGRDFGFLSRVFISTLSMEWESEILVESRLSGQEGLSECGNLVCLRLAQSILSFIQKSARGESSAKHIS